LGYTHFISTPVSPALIYVHEKHGYQTLSQIFYDEPGEIYALTPEEIVKHSTLLRQFKDGLKPSVRLIFKDARLGSPLDKRKL
jgi:hypothetical protein